MRIHLLPVYSKLAQPNNVPREIVSLLPPGIELSEHQLSTYQNILSREHDVIMNTAMTGDGKSLAAYLPTLINPRRRAFAMYPTIELSLDQKKQFENYTSYFQRTIRSDAIWGARLAELARERSAKRRGEVLKERFNNFQVILTNPDIFNLVMNYQYGSNIYSDQELPYTLANNFDDFIFDEFHIFSMPQIVAVITAMLFFLEYAPGEAPRFLFSSATPDPIFLQMMERSGIKFKEVKGSYNTSGGKGWRQVLHPTQLTLHKCDNVANIEEWLHHNLHIIVDHWHNAGQKPKGAIIVNSVVTARRVAGMLADQLRPFGISTGEVTGLVDDHRRREVMENADLIIGTSTIDVGIDFNISLLIFETLDAGSFLQRLGRLGRVRRAEKPFDFYEAHALFSPRTPWIYDRFVKCLQAKGIIEDVSINRPDTLREVVMNEDVFHRPTTFLAYPKRWGVLQAAHVLAVLGGINRENSFQTTIQALQKRYEAVFNLKDFGNASGRYGGLVRQRESPLGKRTGQAILDEVLSFRGTSPFQAAIWDTTTKPSTFVGYDALSLIQNASYIIVDEQAYQDALGDCEPAIRNDALEEMHWAMKDKDEHSLILKILEFYQERETLLLGWENVHIREYTGRVVALKGCVVKAPRTSKDLDLLSRFLRRQWLVCYFTTKKPEEVRKMVNLPPYFPLYLVEQTKTYTATFGKYALLLEAEMLRFRGKNEEEAAIFC